MVFEISIEYRVPPLRKKNAIWKGFATWHLIPKINTPHVLAIPKLRQPREVKTNAYIVNRVVFFIR